MLKWQLQMIPFWKAPVSFAWDEAIPNPGKMPLYSFLGLPIPFWQDQAWESASLLITATNQAIHGW
jgi:hypothetical protein